MPVSKIKSSVFYSSFFSSCFGISRTPRTEFPPLYPKSLSILSTYFKPPHGQLHLNVLPVLQWNIPKRELLISSTWLQQFLPECLVPCTLKYHTPSSLAPHILPAERSALPGILFHPHHSHFSCHCVHPTAVFWSPTLRLLPIKLISESIFPLFKNRWRLPKCSPTSYLALPHSSPQQIICSVNLECSSCCKHVLSSHFWLLALYYYLPFNYQFPLTMSITFLPKPSPWQQA